MLHAVLCLVELLPAVELRADVHQAELPAQRVRCCRWRCARLSCSGPSCCRRWPPDGRAAATGRRLRLVWSSFGGAVELLAGGHQVAELLRAVALRAGGHPAELPPLAMHRVLRQVELLSSIAVEPLHLVDRWAWPGRAAASRRLLACGHQAAELPPLALHQILRQIELLRSIAAELLPLVLRQVLHLVELLRSITAEPLHLVRRWAWPGRAAAGCQAVDRWPPCGRAAAGCRAAGRRSPRPGPSCTSTRCCRRASCCTW